MLVQKKISTPRKILLSIIIFIIIGAIIYLLKDRFFLEGDLAIDSSSQTVDDDSLLPVLEIEIDVEFFNKSQYTSLKQHGNLPVRAADTGRSNPFTAVPFPLIRR